VTRGSLIFLKRKFKKKILKKLKRKIKKNLKITRGMYEDGVKVDLTVGTKLNLLKN